MGQSRQIMFDLSPRIFLRSAQIRWGGLIVRHTNTCARLAKRHASRVTPETRGLGRHSGGIAQAAKRQHYSLDVKQTMYERSEHVSR